MYKTKRESGRFMTAVPCLLLLAATLSITSGCISVPIPQAELDPTRFFVLGTTEGTLPPDLATANLPSVQLQPVEIASYLRTKAMVVRRGEHEIEFREFARWGEPLETGIARVLREELLARGTARVALADRAGRANPDFQYTLSVRVLACEGSADGSVNFRAAWSLSSPESATIRVEGGRVGAGASGIFRPADLRWDGTSEAALVAQLSAGVAGLAQEISAAIAQK